MENQMCSLSTFWIEHGEKNISLSLQSILLMEWFNKNLSFWIYWKVICYCIQYFFSLRNLNQNSRQFFG